MRLKVALNAMCCVASQFTQSGIAVMVNESVYLGISRFLCVLAHAGQLASTLPQLANGSGTGTGSDSDSVCRGWMRKLIINLIIFSRFFFVSVRFHGNCLTLD